MNMRSSLPMSLLTLLPVWSACWLNAPRGEVIHLASGDSVRVLTTGPAIVPNERPGLQIEYNTYISLDDTLALKREALALLVRPATSYRFDESAVCGASGH